ncbi:sulfofructose kinase [Xaviernesmea oryzae]|uniref:Sulfofructose kinase n=1 Tax=Xaviernesmea oryzae TaxID=464029 RepID=A0A1X7DYB7_9HYPH|nr:PfkB family carbohydrate kinase [Xaviernesmea oryzae]SMF23421.1 sulfofructose kinase [Xaviernesmea oryzae]
MTATAANWTERVPTVLCLGLSALDYIWNVGALPTADASKVRASEFAAKGGGMAATAAVAVAKLGGKSVFWGRAGDDTEGRLIRDELAVAGVDVEHYRLFAGARSSVSGIFVDAGGERHIANFRGEGLPLSPDWLPLDGIASMDAVLADPRWPEGVVAAFSAARRAGVPTILDGDVADRTTFQMLLPLTDHAIFSAVGLAAFSGADERDAFAEIRSFGCAVAMVTRGEKGAFRLSGEEVVHHPAYAVDVVDTTGAGDVFHGAYAFAIGAGAPVEEAVGFASAVAALKCTRPDGRSGIPTLNETLKFWRTRQ